MFWFYLKLILCSVGMSTFIGLIVRKIFRTSNSTDLKPLELFIGIPLAILLYTTSFYYGIPLIKQFISILYE